MESAMALIGIGTDLVDIDRAERILVRHGDRALRRFLLPAERHYVETTAYQARHFAVRLAAKEAVYKALARMRGSSAISWRDIEISRDRRGRPGVLLHGKAKKLLEPYQGVRLHLSLTHTARTAGATAVIEGEPSPRG